MDLLRIVKTVEVCSLLMLLILITVPYGFCVEIFVDFVRFPYHWKLDKFCIHVV